MNQKEFQRSNAKYARIIKYWKGRGNKTWQKWIAWDVVERFLSRDIRRFIPAVKQMWNYSEESGTGTIKSHLRIKSLCVSFSWSVDWWVRGSDSVLHAYCVFRRMLRILHVCKIISPEQNITSWTWGYELLPLGEDTWWTVLESSHVFSDLHRNTAIFGKSSYLDGWAGWCIHGIMQQRNWNWSPSQYRRLVNRY